MCENISLVYFIEDEGVLLYCKIVAVRSACATFAFQQIFAFYVCFFLFVF